ncbi:MAG: hypothetical protein FJ357_06940 [Thaumarchaeota archaeon]|nr:hypothetical protein [Nitrososphaerota archaeon]
MAFASFDTVFALDGTQRAEVKNPRLLNSFGDTLSQNINVNQQVQISADVINKQTTPQPFVYIVQIVADNGVTQKLVWFLITEPGLNPQQTFSPAISWNPAKPGTYTAQIYVWDSIKDANALAKKIELKILVS